MPANSFLETPEWFGSAVIGAVIAAIGYVAKLIIELFQSYLDKSRLQRSKLIELQSLLNASRVAFIIQRQHAENLKDMISKNHPKLPLQDSSTIEEKISAHYGSFNAEERELHAIIRSISINALYPTNKTTLKWLTADTFFKVKKNELAKKLVLLESHLILWFAKYKTWMPEHPEHALVYLNDEKNHGLGFPSGIENLVEQEIEK